MTFLDQAIEVTPDVGEQADLHERAAMAAITAARMRHRSSIRGGAALFADTRRPVGEARAIGMQGASLRVLRRQEDSRALLEAAWTRFEDLGDDDPAVVLLARAVGDVAMQLGDYERALEMAERALAASERLGLAEDAAEALITKGTTLFYRGRQWEGRTLLIGARQVAEEAGLSDTALRVMVMLPSFVALDDPRGSLALQQEAIASPAGSAAAGSSSGSCSTRSRTRGGSGSGTGPSARCSR